MATTQEQLNRFFEILASSKLPSELVELLSNPTISHFTVIQSGTGDAQKISVPRLRGALGEYNANTNTPNLINGTGVDGDSYVVTTAGTRDFGSGNITLSVDDVITYLSGKWRKTGYAIKRQTIIDLLGFEPLDKSTYTGDAVSLLQEAKDYSDGLVNGVKWKNPVQVATTANVTLSGEQTIDGVLTSASRILVKDQTTASENGIYLTSSTAWTRTTDADTGEELVYATTKVVSGTANANKIFTCNNDAITLGTTAVTFVSRGDITDHNSTTGIQGGTTNEYYHLTLAQRDKAIEDEVQLYNSAATGVEGVIYLDSVNNTLYQWKNGAYSSVGGGGSSAVSLIEYGTWNPGDDYVFTVTDSAKIFHVFLNGNRVKDTLVTKPTATTIAVDSSLFTGQTVALDLTFAGSTESAPGGSTTVEDNLTSTSTTNALSANQGRVLNENKLAKTANIQAIWTGTQVDYDAITTKDANTLYFIQ